MIQAIIFDMDGVLVQTLDYIIKSFQILLKNDSVHINADEMRKYLGRSMRDILIEWEKDYRIKKYDPVEFSKKAGQIELDLLNNEIEANTNLVKLLNDAKKRGIKLAVATSSTKWRAHKILELLCIKDKFDTIVTAEDVTKHKPNPEIFLEAAKRIGAKPENCIVFEDAISGIKAAKSAGMRAIAININSYTQEELGEADMIVDGFEEIDITDMY